MTGVVDELVTAKTMLGIGRLTVRQAEEALANGRLEEAHRLLEKPEARGHKGSSPLLRQLADALIARGKGHLEHGDSAAAWSDLLLVETTGTGGAAAFRQELTRRTLDEAEKLLEAGQPARALEVLASVQQGGVRQADVQLMEEAAQGWSLARDLAARGEFGLAYEKMERVRSLMSRSMGAVERFVKELLERRQGFAALLVELHGALESEQWREVVGLTEKMLAMAPQHAEARKARARAWKAIEPAAMARPRPLEDANERRRFLLWIDGVGGYLVCLSSKVTLGQAAPDAYVDVPIFADVSRAHATLMRDPGGYVIEGLRPVQVNGTYTERALLQPEDRITLGSLCQLQFRQPVPVSSSARLDFVSGHRLPLAVDGVLLMADTLVFGPGSHAHVTIPDLQQPVILYRNKEGLGVRHAGTFKVDGQNCRERGLLTPSSRVSGDDFALALETVGPRMGAS